MATAVATSKFEREKWAAEHQLKKDELALKGRELDIRERESRRARWSNPLVLAIAGAALAAVGNIVATYYTGVQQRDTEAVKHRAEQERERERSESQLILEVIRTANPDKAAENLAFLVRTSLINDRVRREAISKYVDARPAGTGVTLPTSSTPGWSDFTSYSSVMCRVSGTSDIRAVTTAIADSDGKDSKTQWSFDAGGAKGSTEYFLAEPWRSLFNSTFVDYAVVMDGKEIVVHAVTRSSNKGVAVSARPFLSKELYGRLSKLPNVVSTCGTFHDDIKSP
jgi:hypothetical protein